MSFAVNQFTGFGTPSSLVPAAANEWNFMNQSLVDTIDGATLSFARDKTGSGSTNSWYWDDNLDYVSDADGTTPRWEYYPADIGDASAGDPRGLLIEGIGHRTSASALVNANSYSYELNSNSQWAETNISFPSTSEASPDGANRGIKHVATVANATHYNYSGVYALTGATVGRGVAVQMHYKNVDAAQRYFMMEFTAGTSTYQAVFDTTGHAVTDTAASGAGGVIYYTGVKEVADGYYNAILICQLTGSTSCNLRYYLGDGDQIADHTGAWAGDGSSAITFWNCMVNYTGVAMNHKLSTVADTDSRGDGCRILTSSLNDFNADEGTLWCEFEWPEEAHFDSAYLGGIGDGGNTDYIMLGCGRDDGTLNPRHWAFIRENNVSGTANLEDFVNPTTSTIHRCAITWNRNTSEMQSAYDGEAATRRTSYAIPTSDHLDYLYVGRLPSGDATALWGQGLGKHWSRKFRYYNKALTEAELKLITTLDG